MPVAVVVFVVCVVACVVAHAVIFVSVAGRRASSVNPSVPRPRLGVEIAWALLPALVLALVLTATWQRVREREQHAPNMLMRVSQ